MATKIVKGAFNNLLAKTFYNYIRYSSAETFYASLAYLPDSDHLVYLDKVNYSIDPTLVDSDLYRGGTDSTFLDQDDKVYYSQNSIAMHRLYQGGVTRVIPRIDWSYGNTYNSWPDDNSYVLVKEYILGNSRYNVYSCLFSPKTVSTISPLGNSISPIEMEDGYVWKYMYTIDTAYAYNFLSTSWMPILERVDQNDIFSSISGVKNSDFWGAQTDLYQSQEAAESFALYSLSPNDSDQELYNLLTLNGSSKRRAIGFTDDESTADSESWPSTFSFTMVGEDKNTSSPISKLINSSPDSDWSNHDNSYKVKVSYDSDASPQFSYEMVNKGSGYYGPVEMVIQDSDEKIRLTREFTPNVAPGEGHGSYITEELDASHVMINIKVPPDPDERYVTLMDGVNYNLLSLVHNPIDAVTGKIATSDFYVTCYKAQISRPTIWRGDTKFLNGETQIHVAATDSDVIYFTIPKDSDGYASVTTGMSVQTYEGALDPTSPTIVRLYDQEVVFNSGNILMSEFELIPSVRSTSQMENLNFILKFK